MIPERIGRYQVHSVLGAGGFATVFLAHDPDLEAWVAIKVLADNMSRDAEFRDRFVREARVMRQLQTPGLVTVYDIGDHQGSPYFVMEYCERGTLADRIDGLGRPLTAAEGYHLAQAIAACTGHIHRAGMVHRDLKPSNYLIRSQRHAAPGTPTGNAVLAPDEELAVADFGLAKVVDLDASRVSIAGGTPGYSAPEQFRGDPSVDASADVYAASAMIASALTGQQPKPVLVVGDSAFDPAALSIAGPLAGELSRGMAVDKSQRHADINIWFQALSNTVSGPVPSQPTMAAPGTAAPDLAAQTPTAHQGADFAATTPVNPGPATAPGAPIYAPPSGQPSAANPTAPSVPSAPAPTQPPAGPGGQGASVSYPPPSRPADSAPAAFHQAPAHPAPQPVVDTGPGAQPWSDVESPTVTSGSSGRSRLPMLAGLGLLAVAAIGALALAFTGGLGLTGGGDITGPTTGLVGQEAVFATTDGSTGTWTVGDAEFVGRSIALVPATAGWVRVNVEGDGSSAEVIFTATEAEGDGSGLTIEGPGTVTVGQPLTVTSGGGIVGTWTVDGEQYEGAAIELTPSSAGIIAVSFEAEGQTVERVLTAVEAG